MSEGSGADGEQDSHSVDGGIDDDGDCPTTIEGLDGASDVEVAPGGRQVYVVLLCGQGGPDRQRQ